MSDHIERSLEDGVMRLRFNRPDKKNAITQDMYSALADGLSEADADDEVRAVYFEAAGDLFTAGNDIGEFLAMGLGSGVDHHETPPVQRFLTSIASAQSPLVAAVQGPAVGVGVTMLLHCDFVYASERATFHTPFIDLALVPEAGSSILMPAIAGYQRASEMLLLGEKLDAARARDFGFVNEVCAPDALEETALGVARRLARKAPTALRLSKGLMKAGRQALLEHMAEENRHFGAQLQSPEFREAGQAFMEKRKPDFSKTR